MKRITINHRLAGTFEGFLQFRNSANTAVVVAERVTFKGRDGKEKVYPKNTIFTMLNADIIEDKIEKNPTAPMTDDPDRCPDCGTLMNVVTVPKDNNTTQEEATCPGCGYTEA